jgi:integrase
MDYPAITLREAYDRYLHDNPPLEERTVIERRTALKHWERLTGNLPLPLPLPSSHPQAAQREAIDRQRHVEFTRTMRAAEQQLATEIAATTVNKYFHRTLNVLLRRLSPPSFSNPDGVGLVSLVYKFRRLAEDPKDPSPMTVGEVAACYEAADFARWPRATHRWEGYGIPPGDWWRAVIVFEFNCGLRTGDFLKLRCDQVNLRNSTIRFRAEKTDGSKGSQTKPLHPTVVDHLRRIWTPPRDVVFPAPRTKDARMEAWITIQRWAGVKPPAESGLDYYRLKDLRSTCGTALFEVSPAAAQQMLGHSSMPTSSARDT